MGTGRAIWPGTAGAPGGVRVPDRVLPVRQDQLGRDDFSYGQFGRTPPVRGLADDQVCSATGTGSGRRCSRSTRRGSPATGSASGWRPAVPGAAGPHHRPGFTYGCCARARSRPGMTSCGGRRARAMTVAEVDALLYLPGHSREQVTGRCGCRAARWVAGLVPGDARPARGAGRRGGQLRPDGGPPAAWPGFRPVVVSRPSGRTGR